MVQSTPMSLFKLLKLTLLVQLAVLSFQVLITGLMVLIFPFHERYVFGGFLQNLSSTRLHKNDNNNNSK